MPTGSLCAERNAIGSALASDLTLTRRDLCMIGVLAMRFDTDHEPKHGDSGKPSCSPGSGPAVEQGGGMPAAVAAAAPSTSSTPVLTAEMAPSSNSPPRSPTRKRPRTTSTDVPITGMHFSTQPNTSQTLHHNPLRGINPLIPCGACMEWLKKIADVNPGFRVVTFTDTSCDEAFVTTVENVHSVSPG